MGEYFVGKGVRLVLVDFNCECFDEIVVVCKVVGGDVCVYVCNVVDEEQVIYMVVQVVSDFGVINGLVNNVGIFCDGLIIKVKDGQLSKMSLV